jgi:hypothetical protein
VVREEDPSRMPVDGDNGDNDNGDDDDDDDDLYADEELSINISKLFRWVISRKVVATRSVEINTFFLSSAIFDLVIFGLHLCKPLMDATILNIRHSAAVTGLPSRSVGDPRETCMNVTCLMSISSTASQASSRRY